MVLAENKAHLSLLIRDAICSFGPNCSLNHIDTSKIEDMSGLFYQTKFNGDISAWDTSKVKNMNRMFAYSAFHGNLDYMDITSLVEFEGIIFNRTDLDGNENLGEVPYWMFYKDKKERDEKVKVIVASSEKAKKLCFTDVIATSAKVFVYGYVFYLVARFLVFLAISLFGFLFSFL